MVRRLIPFAEQANPRRAGRRAGGRLAGLLAVTALIATGCGDSGDADAVSLEGTGWSLATLGGEPAVAGSDATLSFEAGGRFSGNTGCNAYSGTWSADGSALTLEVGPMTRALCGDEALQAQEDGFVAALGATKSYAVTDAVLTIEDGSGDALATLNELSTDLAGSSWVATAVNNGRGGVVGVVPGSEITAEFAADGTLVGSGGCNRYNSTWAVQPGAADGRGDIEIAAPAATRRACEPDVDAQEVAYFIALANAATFELTPQRLQLRSADGALQVDFQRIP